MYYVTLLFPLPLLWIVAYFFNKTKMNDTKGQVIYMSILHGSIAFLLTSIVLLQGYFLTPFFGILFFIIALLLGFASVLFKREFEGDLDLQIETTKNTIVLYSISIILLYVLLSSTRFLHPIFQITISVAVTALYVYLVLKGQRHLSNLYDFLSFRNLRTVSYAAVYVFFGLAVVLLIGLFFNFPSYYVNNALSLEHHSDFYEYQDAPISVTNRYDSTRIASYEVEDRLVDGIPVFEADSTHIFLFYSTTLVIIERETNTILYEGSRSSYQGELIVPSSSAEENETDVAPECASSGNCFASELEFTYKGVFITIPPFCVNTIT